MAEEPPLATEAPPATEAAPRVGARFRGAILLLAVVVGVCWISIPRPHAPIEVRNPGVRANVNTVGMGVAQYALDHDGALPPGGIWATTLRTGDYLPGNRLPLSPWAKVPQTQALRPEAPLVGARAIAAGATPTPVRTDLGAGRVPDGETWDQRTYGALIYDVDPKGGTYVLYGVGKKWKRAIVVAGG